MDPGAPRESARRAGEAFLPGGVLYYGLGGGLGHLTRGLAIARQFRRLARGPFTLLTNCGAPVPDPADLLLLSGPPDPEPERLADLVRELVRALRPRVLAVDAFPAGLLGELPDVLPSLPCSRVAVVRRLQARWIAEWRLAELLPSVYNTVAWVEPGAVIPGLPPSLRAVETPPVLVRDAAELLPRDQARERWGHSGPAPLACAVVTSPRPADQGLLGVASKAVRNAVPDAAVTFATPYPGGLPAGDYRFHYPLLEWLPGVDLVIGPCGYNLCHETAALGVPAVFIPQPRRYDDQFARSEGRPVARSPEELERLAKELLSRPHAPAGPPGYGNGAVMVARLLAGQC